MTQGYGHLFNKLSMRQPGADLIETVMRRIAAYEERRLKVRALIHGVLTFGSLSACIYGVQYLMAASAESGFSQYVSLFLSDSGYVFSHAKEFALSLSDALPVSGLVAILGGILILVYSATYLVTTVRSLTQFNRRLTA